MIVTYQQSVFQHYHSGKHFPEFLPTRWQQKSTGIDMEQNYVTVTRVYSKRLTVVCRPYFTYWVTFVQLTCFFFMISVYGLASFGFHYVNITGQVNWHYSAVE